MRLTQRPIWGMELFIGGLALCGLLALATAAWRERDMNERFAMSRAQTPTRPWTLLCAEATQGSHAMQEYAQLDRQLREGRQEEALRLWADMYAGVACALRQPPRPELAGHGLALELMQRTVRWAQAYPGWAAELANRAGRWQPRTPILQGAGHGAWQAAWPELDAAQQAQLLEALELDAAQAAFSDWLRALRLPAAERADFLAKQPGAPRWQIEPERLLIRSWRPELQPGQGGPEFLALELPL